MVMISSAPRASAIERKRLMLSAARLMAAWSRCPSRSVSWPSRTTSFSRTSTAKESLEAASTTTSLIELEPMSIAASFNGDPVPFGTLCLPYGCLFCLRLLRLSPDAQRLNGGISDLSFINHARDGAAQICGDAIDGARSIHHAKPVLALHSIKLSEHTRLIFDEAVVEIFAQVKVHAGFPVIEAAPGSEYARDQLFSRAARVKPWPQKRDMS